MYTHIMQLQGLDLYLEIRNWALEKMSACPRGSPVVDMEIYHYLYFSNGLSAVDLVGEAFYGKRFRERPYETDCERSLVAAFDFGLATVPKYQGKAGREAYAYVRELRNSIVHRGLDSAAVGHATDDLVFALCPTTVHDFTGNNAYSSPCKYMVELAELSNVAFDKVVDEELCKHQVFESGPPQVTAQDLIEFLKSSDAMPDWAKTMASQAFLSIDCQKIVAEASTARMRKLKALLGRSH
jgi:hypothetical protein